MNPIFFPATWIPQADRDLLLACFRQITVLQPARKLVPETLWRLEKTGRLDIRLPDDGADPLPNLLKAYHAWADLHQGEPPDFRKFTQFARPAPEDISTGWIRNQIRHHERDNTESRDRNPGPDPFLMTRLFLAIVQEYDQQRESLSRDLNDISAMEKNMFRDLSPDQSSPSFIAAERPVRMRVETERPIPPEKRLASWRRLFAHCHGPSAAPKTSPSPFFVTNDQDALHLASDSVETPELVCRIEGILSAGEEAPFSATTVHQKIDELLHSAARGGPLSSPSSFSFANQAVDAVDTGRLIIYRMKGNPAAPVNSGPGAPPDSPGATETGGESRYTLLGYIEKNCVLDSPKQLV